MGQLNVADCRDPIRPGVEGLEEVVGGRHSGLGQEARVSDPDVQHARLRCRLQLPEEEP